MKSFLNNNKIHRSFSRKEKKMPNIVKVYEYKRMKVHESLIICFAYILNMKLPVVLRKDFYCLRSSSVEVKTEPTSSSWTSKKGKLRKIGKFLYLKRKKNKQPSGISSFLFCVLLQLPCIALGVDNFYYPKEPFSW